MPVVAVGAAVFAGVEIATVGLAAMSTFGAIAAIGAVTAGIGVVTGNKELTSIGAVMGVVGGIGSLASSKGLLGEGSAFEAASAADDAAAVAAPAAGDVAAKTLEGVINTGAPDVAATVEKAVAAPAASAEVVGDSGLLDGAVAAGDGGYAPGMNALAKEMANPSVLDTFKVVGKDVMQFAKDNQMLTYGMTQVGGNFIGGLFDTTKESQKKAFESRAVLEQTQAGMLNQQAANLAAPIPVASTPAGAQRPNVYGATTAPTYHRPNVGLINVTGKV